jgi:hypothetical protein
LWGLDFEVVDLVGSNGMGRKPKITTDLRKEFTAAGFEIVEAGTSPGSIGVKKYNCVQYLELKAEHAWLPLGASCFIIRGLNYELEDRGYQKFWHHRGARFPVRKADLQALHRFDEEVRQILCLRSLYNESLGSTCARTVYDRLNGRPDR